MVTWCEQLTHWKRTWCWEKLKAEREEGVRGGDGWMASPMQWTWTWASPGDGEGQGELACCHPAGHKESHMTGQQNNNNNMWDLSSLTSIKPTPSALEDAVLTTGLPGKSQLSQILELTSESNFSGSTESINELSLTVLVIQRKVFNFSTFAYYKDSGKVISKAERLHFLCQAVYLVDYTVHMVIITLELFFFPITWLHENYILKLKQKKSFQKV